MPNQTPPNQTPPNQTMARKLMALCAGVLCHVSFGIAVLTMMAAMYFGMTRSLGRVLEPWNWVANAALLIQFPVVHSLLLTGRGRRLLARLAPLGAGSTLSATTYATIAAFGVFALFAFWSPTGVILWQAHGSVLVVMTALYAASWLLLGKSMIDAGLSLQTGALGWFALFRGRRPVYPPMPESGLFRLTRQPIYLAFTMTLWTVPTWTPDQLVVAVTLTGYCLVAPRFKEARFRRIYGREFDRYAAAVPYWLPWPRPRLSGGAGEGTSPAGKTIQ